MLSTVAVPFGTSRKTLSEEIKAPAEEWVRENEGKERRGEARQLLLLQLMAKQPGKSDLFLQSQLTRMLCKIRGVIKPERTPKRFKPRTVGDPTGHSKERSDERNAVHSPPRRR